AHIRPHHAGERRWFAEGGPRPAARHLCRRTVGRSVTLAIPHRDTLGLGLALSAALAPLALLAALNPTYRVAPVTAIIMLLSTSGAQIGPVRYAIDRVLEIGIGCLVGFAVSLLI